MVYTKLIKADNKLRNFCKNCNWEGEYLSNVDESICIFKKIYSNEHLAQKTFSNKYAVFDPSLPRINNITCINKECITNKSFHLNRTLHITVLNNDVDNLEWLANYYSSLGLQVDSFSNVSLNGNEIITELSDEGSNSIFEHLYNEQLVVKDPSDNTITFNIKKYVQPKREILFMKYDVQNLKYLYLCSSCHTTWKTN